MVLESRLVMIKVDGLVLKGCLFLALSQAKHSFLKAGVYDLGNLKVASPPEALQAEQITCEDVCIL